MSETKDLTGGSRAHSTVASSPGESSSTPIAGASSPETVHRPVAERLAGIDNLPAGQRMAEAREQTEMLLAASPRAAGKILRKIYDTYLLKETGVAADGATVFSISPEDAAVANDLLLQLVQRSPTTAAEVIEETPGDLQQIQWDALREGGADLLRRDPEAFAKFLNSLESEDSNRLAWEVTELVEGSEGAAAAVTLWQDLPGYSFNPERVIQSIRVNGRVPYGDEPPSF